ncbi:MAG: VWA domain-containing protein [Lachnospiraceae bacterium]|nr:VWA domain-containing protein [Lachnospiraceae bacterium]
MGEAKTLAFVLMLDTSGSMWNAIDMVKIDAKAFIRQARVGDQFAINEFSDNGSWVYPAGTNPKLLTVKEGLHETEAALDYIEKLKTHNMTAMGEAIQIGNQIMKNTSLTSDLKAYVILSDGAHNQGVNPVSVLGSEPPVYIAALGNVSKRYFDQLTAKNPKSRFYNQPNAYQMMLMFNQILADANDNELMLNDLDTYKKGADYVLKRFRISSEDNAAQVNVVWSDKKYEYTSGMPGGNAINIVLIDPDDKNTDIKPDIAEDGYCIYNLENVKPGEWKVLVQYSVPEVIRGTAGGVDYYTDIKTKLLLPQTIRKDEPLDIRVCAEKNGEVLDQVKVTAQIASPILSEADVRKRYARKLNAIQRKLAEKTDEETESADEMELLRSEILNTEKTDIFAKRISTHRLSLSKEGDYRLELDGKNQSGLCNVDIRIEGIDPKTKLPFTRIKSQAVYIE